MELTHSFTVPGPVADTWVRFQDIADIAQCFPGAQVTSAEGDTFEGTVKVKLGPIALVYAGSGTFTSKDEDAHRFVVEAKGRDKRGNGTAAATVTVTMTDADGDATTVQVDTDLGITGKPAQFGRGVMQDVSDKLLGQFVTCLEQRSAAAPAVDEAASSLEEDGATPAEEVDQDGLETSGGFETGASAPSSTSGSAPSSTSGGSAPSSTSGGSVSSSTSGGSASSSTGGGSAASSASGGVSAPEALDLGATVLPVLAKSYWKQALAGVVGLVVLVGILRRLLR